MEEIVSRILKEEIMPTQNSLVYDYVQETPTSIYYDNFFGIGRPQGIELPELYYVTTEKAKRKKPENKVMDEILFLLEKRLHKEAIVIEIGGGAQQWRSSNAYMKFSNYFPVDISRPNIGLYAKKYNRIGFIADAAELPFKDHSIDCIFTHDFLEHPIYPEKVLCEITRVLKNGGIVIHNDSWFCRWWQHYGIVNLKKMRNMTFREIIILFASKITEFPIIRISPVIIRRLVHECLETKLKPIKLHYKKLKPNYNLYLGCDEDAASSIDPLDVIRFYESRGFKTSINHSFMQRLLYRNKYIMLEYKKI